MRGGCHPYTMDTEDRGVEGLGNVGTVLTGLSTLSLRLIIFSIHLHAFGTATSAWVFYDSSPIHFRNAVLRFFAPLTFFHSTFVLFFSSSLSLCIGHVAPSFYLIQK